MEHGDINTAGLQFLTASSARMVIKPLEMVRILMLVHNVLVFPISGTARPTHPPDPRV